MQNGDDVRVKVLRLLRKNNLKQAILTPEIVMEQCLVDSCYLGYFTHPRRRKPFLHKHFPRCFENGFFRTYCYC